MPTKDELTQAVDADDIDEVRKVIRRNAFNPQGKTAQAALVNASGRGRQDIVDAMLAWGTPPDSADEVGRRAIHLAAEKGAAGIARALCEKDADPNVLSLDGTNAMNISLNAPFLPVVKVLLKYGAKLPASANVPGLAGVVREVQLETLTDELTQIAKTTTSCADEVIHADGAVWEAMNEHMRLLRLREEQKAGETLIELQTELEEEKKAAKDAKENEEFLMKDLIDKKILLQKSQNQVEDLKRAIEKAETDRDKTIAEDIEANSEVATFNNELNAAKKEQLEAEKLFAEKEKERDSLGGRQKVLQDELAEARSRHQRLRDQLRTESAELRGWERDKEAAAQLTAQAGRVLAKDN